MSGDDHYDPSESHPRERAGDSGDALAPGGLLDGLPEEGRGAGSLPPLPEPAGKPEPPSASGLPLEPRTGGTEPRHNVIPFRAQAPTPHRDEGQDRHGARHAVPGMPSGAAHAAPAEPLPAPPPAPPAAAAPAAEPTAVPPDAAPPDPGDGGGSGAGDGLPAGGPGAEHAYPPAEREAVYRAIRDRRDVRTGFRPDPIPDAVLTRVLESAHRAPSVGFSQPWDFVVVADTETRHKVRELARRQRDAYAGRLPGARARAFSGLKVEAILEAPCNIVVTNDPTRGGRHTLGRHAQPQTSGYSVALAVENLWLSARAEGLGVGWVSFFEERELARELDLPPHLEVVAYLCVGYVEEFPTEPELALGGWAKRRPLSWAVHAERYGRRGLPGQERTSLLQETVGAVAPLNRGAIEDARRRHEQLTKPSGSLGILEDVSVQLAGLAGECPPPMPEPAAVAVFAADHGVHAQGVTPWPQEVTVQMVHNFLNGGAVVNAFAAQAGAEVSVVDVGVAGDVPAVPGLLPRKIARGTADFTQGPAMTRTQVEYALEAGIEVARDLVAAGNRCLVTGDMGIGNTTASAALIAAFTGRDVAEVTGRGTGIDDTTLDRKIEVVRRGLAANRIDPADPVGVLAAVGGLEHAALAGFILGGAALRVPVLLDGVIAGAAGLAAVALAPDALSACVAGHRSSEPGHTVALERLSLRPLVDLELRLGEGTGALLALPLLQGAARALRDVATFDDAGVARG